MDVQAGERAVDVLVPQEIAERVHAVVEGGVERAAGIGIAGSGPLSRTIEVGP